jgi:hypothetical protein
MQGATQHQIEPGEVQREPVISLAFSQNNLDTNGLFQAFFDQIVWHAISTQRCPGSIPVELGCILCLDQI